MLNPEQPGLLEWQARQLASVAGLQARTTELSGGSYRSGAVAATQLKTSRHNRCT
jgi:hypothetical protein